MIDFQLIAKVKAVFEIFLARKESVQEGDGFQVKIKDGIAQGYMTHEGQRIVFKAQIVD